MTLRKKAGADKQNQQIQKLEKKLEETQRELKAAELINKELEQIYKDGLVSKFQIPKQKKPRGKRKKSFYRVAFGDTHGASLDPDAWAAFVGDLEKLRPRELIHLGDIIDAGGWLAQHQTLGYLAEVETSYADDINAANQMWDSVQAICPDSTIYAIEGNHDMRVEKWCIAQTLRHQLDSRFLFELLAPQNLTFLEKRGIQYFKRDQVYGELKNNSGSIMLGKCAFTHPQRASKHHASKMASDWGCNVVYGHTHRRDYFPASNAHGKDWSAWSPGCLCVTRKYWHHSENFNHNQGYHLQIVQESGDFLGINIPILGGKSYLSDLLGAL